MISIVAFDADDTLWHNNLYFNRAQDSFLSMMENFAKPTVVKQILLDCERRNIARYGFGIKGFTLSMIEAAIEISASNAGTGDIHRIIKLGQDLLDHPVRLLPDVEPVISSVSRSYNTILITKGDLLDQERKIQLSGLSKYFRQIEIVSVKTADVYRQIFTRSGSDPASCVMVGNSLRFDIVPALKIGAWSIHIPYEFGWELEHDDLPSDSAKYRQIERFLQLPDQIAEIRELVTTEAVGCDGRGALE